MVKYIALLRGINVSGRNKIAMPQLRAAFEQKGFTEVMTYINSGNVLFSSDIQEKKRLIDICEALILEHFDLNISVAIVAVDELAETLTHAPEWWDQAEETVHYAIFMIPPMTITEVLEIVGEIKPEYEKIAHYGEVIFLTCIESVKFSHELIALKREYPCLASQTSFIGNKQKLSEFVKPFLFYTKGKISC